MNFIPKQTVRLFNKLVVLNDHDHYLVFIVISSEIYIHNKTSKITKGSVIFCLIVIL